LKGNWARYKDADGDGIPYRTLPGNQHPASSYFTRGTGHDENARYSEEPEVWANVLLRIKRKYHNAAKLIPAPVIDQVEGATTGIIAFGSTDPAIQEARYLLEAEAGLKSDSMRIRGIPFSQEVREFIESHEQNVVVEMNRDGQMYQLLLVEYPDLAGKLSSVAFNDGLPATAKWVKESILSEEVKV
jgi:2-oxoglutarate ferredoxin oxidoreductase subunit alpha